MRLTPYFCYKPTIKVFCACAVTFLLTSYMFWNGCNVPNKAKYEEMQRNVLPSELDCAKLVSKSSTGETRAIELEKTTPCPKPKPCPKDSQYSRMDVLINAERRGVEGLLDTDTNEAYVPFSFIKQYFEIYGGIKSQDQKKFLEWKHSYSEIHDVKSGLKYDPKGPFLWFQNYRVEGRTRVKCISGIESVPVSVQWSAEGYFYPIQIAQYGLSHYSLLQIQGDSKENVKIYEDGESPSEQNWLYSEDVAQVRNVFDKEHGSRVIAFSTRGKTVYLNVGDCNITQYTAGLSLCLV